MEKQNQLNNKKEQLKQLELYMSICSNMLWAFKQGINEKEVQVRDLQQKIDALKGEIDKEEKSSESVKK